MAAASNWSTRMAAIYHAILARENFNFGATGLL